MESHRILKYVQSAGTFGQDLGIILPSRDSIHTNIQDLQGHLDKRQGTRDICRDIWTRPWDYITFQRVHTSKYSRFGDRIFEIQKRADVWLYMLLGPKICRRCVRLPNASARTRPTNTSTLSKFRGKLC